MLDFLSAAPKEAWGEISAAHRAIFGTLRDIGKQDMYPIFCAARELAEQRAPGHPLIRRLSTPWDFDEQRIDAPTYLAHIEVAIKEGMKDRRTAYALYEARLKALGVMETLKFPPPDLPSGIWAYSGAIEIPELVEEASKSLSQAQQTEVQQWSTNFQHAVYEQGLVCMERYFETGKGHPYDAPVHFYSMLCNNLAINYRDDDERYQDAIDLHQRGIAASSFAEHYDGILWSQIGIGDNEGIAEAAEQLWHYAEENGFSRHNPNEYINKLATALRQLDRDNEIPIWLERLVKWQHEQEEVNENSLPADFLKARLQIGFDMAYRHPDESLALWNHLKPQVDASSNENVVFYGGDLLRSLNRYAEAAVYYERTLALNKHSEDYDKGFDASTSALLASCREKAKAQSKSWWQVWK
jgi:tetratricopeptide (TPR) repeat protein